MSDADRLAEIREEYVGWGDQWDLVFLLRLLDERGAENKRLQAIIDGCPKHPSFGNDNEEDWELWRNFTASWAIAVVTPAQTKGTGEGDTQ